MRAGRLVSLLLLLERRGRLTAGQLAQELEVSERTILRDVEHLSSAGVPVYGVRGPGGGFALLDGWQSHLDDAGSWQPSLRSPGAPRRARVRVTADGRRLAAVMGRLQPLRVRGEADGGRQWRSGSFRMGSLESTALEVLSLGPEIEVLEPEALRVRVGQLAREVADLYARELSGLNER